jgi:hypothetical protein
VSASVVFPDLSPKVSSGVGDRGCWLAVFFIFFVSVGLTVLARRRPLCAEAEESRLSVGGCGACSCIVLGVLGVSSGRLACRYPGSSRRRFGGAAPTLVGSFVEAVRAMPKVVLIRGVCRLGWPIRETFSCEGGVFSEDVYAELLSMSLSLSKLGADGI